MSCGFEGSLFNFLPKFKLNTDAVIYGLIKGLLLLILLHNFIYNFNKKLLSTINIQ